MAGRSGRIGIILAISVAVLVVFCLGFFFSKDSSVNTTPGLNFHPTPPSENSEKALITYKGTEYEGYRKWTDELDRFLAVYKTPGLTSGRAQNIFNCNYNQPPPPGSVCDVNLKSYGPCVQENNYSYHKSSPCVFINLDRISGWKPEFYNRTNELPANMPERLKQSIQETSPQELNTVWVSCEGETAADIENIGPIEYYPRLGFPGYFFPYNNTEGYLDPLVAVHFVRPTRGVLINVKCKAWAHNIMHNETERSGSVHFELMID